MKLLHGLEDQFEQVNGRRPTHDELRVLLRWQEVIGLRNDDALMPLLMVFINNESKISGLPERVEAAAVNATAKVQTATDNIAADAAARVYGAMLDKLDGVVGQLARQVRIKASVRFMYATVMVVVIGALATATVGYKLGYETGANKERGEIGDAAAWTRSSAGIAAKALADSGYPLEAVATCKTRGVQLRGNWCYSKKPLKWRIPNSVLP